MKTSLYIHWPFCESKCPYCDFNSHVREKINYQNWEDAYLKEIEFYADNFFCHTSESWYLDSCFRRNDKGGGFSKATKQLKITSIFFGGGTPSLMNPQTIEKILNLVNKKFSLEKNIEITLEANPSSSEIEKFKAFKRAGVNRLSLGIQSFNEENLKFLGRRHNAKEAIKAIEMAGQVYDNFSFDLIYALPSQNIKSWQQELDFAFKFGSPHLSLYQLTIEKGTDFYGRYKRKEFYLPPTETQNQLYDFTVKKAAEVGLKQYEISNFAKKGFESKHNLNYWQYGDYIGIGSGAHGRLEGSWKLEVGSANKKNLQTSNFKLQTLNIHSPENWLEAVNKNSHGLQSTSKLTYDEQLEEVVYMGLRIKKGLNKKQFKDFTGKEFEEYFSAKIIKNLVGSKYLKLTKTHVKPTYAGLKLHRGIIYKLFEVEK